MRVKKQFPLLFCMFCECSELREPKLNGPVLVSQISRMEAGRSEATLESVVSEIACVYTCAHAREVLLVGIIKFF